MHRLHGVRSATLMLCLMLAGLAIPVATLADDCDAEVRAELMEKSEDVGLTRLQFRVEISSTSDCAKVLYDLIIEEQLPNGQSKRIRKPTVQKLGEDTLSSVQRHEMPAGHRLLSYDAKVVSCTPCNATP